MKNHNPIYVNKWFYAGDPFKGYDPRVEIEALNYLLERMLDQGKFEVAGIIKDRLNNIEQQLITKQSWCILMEVSWSLN